MTENSRFTSIPEPDNRHREQQEYEVIIKGFFRSEMNTETLFESVRAHRIGQRMAIREKKYQPTIKD